jgi:hypothetical protein
MAYRFFRVPVRDSGAAEEEVNRFLRGHRVLSVDRRWVDLGTESYWRFCVDYLETGATRSVVQGDKVLVVPGQHRAALGDRPGWHPSIGNRHETAVGGEHEVVPGRLQPGGRAAAAPILVDQAPHGRGGRSRPRARTSAASRSRSASIRGEWFAT